MLPFTYVGTVKQESFEVGNFRIFLARLIWYCYRTLWDIKTIAWSNYQYFVLDQ